MGDLNEIILWTTQEVATQLNVSKRTVTRLINNGELPFVQIGRSIRVSREDLFNFVDQQRRYNLGCVESALSQSGESLCDSINVEAFTTLPTNREVENKLDALLKPMTNK